MKQFPAAANFSSWSGLAAGDNESAGKKKRALAMKGNPHIKIALVEAARSATRTRQSGFQDRYQRLRTKMGNKRAIVASAHTAGTGHGRGYPRRLERLENRLAPNLKLPEFLIKFVDESERVVSTLRLKDGGREWWQTESADHEPQDGGMTSLEHAQSSGVLGHGAKFGRKKEEAVAAALLTYRTLKGAARAVNVSTKTLSRWQTIVL